MKFVDEYRDPKAAQACLRRIATVVTQPWVIMEVCGGQTHAIVRYGIDQLLPEGVRLVHGPGCPVCVTPVSMIDHAIALARRPDVIFTTFGDMARVPGSDSSLLMARSQGADVRLVYSPLDALKIAHEHPEREVVFFSVGFETTAPSTALAAQISRHQGLKNFSMLVAHVRVPPALRAMLDAPTRVVQGFLAAGHVCTIMGVEEYRPIVERYQVPIVVTGFEPLDILLGLESCLRQLEAGEYRVDNQYARAVTSTGNLSAQAALDAVFEVVPRRWRGLDVIAESGLHFKSTWQDLDAIRRFDLLTQVEEQETECQSGAVLQGLLKPTECPAFGRRCTPERPLGAPMVSSEGACAAYFRHRRHVSPVMADS